MALAIFISHFNVATESHLWFPISGYFRVSAFFVMSGFLIYGSYFRCGGWRSFLANRLWRIMPSYLLTVVVCALTLVLVSDCGPKEYFMSWHWLKYLIVNSLSLNFLEPTLPGVFSGHPLTSVNASLWTMKVEWCLYFMVIPIVWWTRRSKWSFWKIFSLIFLLSVTYKYVFIWHYEHTGKEIYSFIAKQFGGQLAFFYSGVLLYVYLDKVKGHKWMLAAVSVPVLILGWVWWPYADLYRFVLFPLTLAGTLIALAFIGRWGACAEMFENCSYEIYLFHFPIVQLSYHFGLKERIGAFPAFLCVFAVTAVLAYLVARYVSAPLRRRHRTSLDKRRNESILPASDGNPPSDGNEGQRIAVEGM
ncbi:MAG: acyltransferase [Bacteroides sp.]|nr:acyltransferase [Bacteroides sp.]